MGGSLVAGASAECCPRRPVVGRMILPARTPAHLPRGDVGIAPYGTNILIESLVICRALLFIGGKLDRTVLLFVLIYTQLGEMFQLGIQGAMILAGDVGDLTQKRFRKTYAGLDAVSSQVITLLYHFDNILPG